MGMATLDAGTVVVSREYSLGTLGTVLDVSERGATIEFVTPPSSMLPYGCINLEFWPVSDFEALTVLEIRNDERVTKGGR